MSRHGIVLLGNIGQLLMCRSSLRPLERCGWRLKPVSATFATLRAWPGIDQQQHRNFATGTTSTDDDEDRRKKHEKHKKQSLAIGFNTANSARDNQPRDLANKVNSFMTTKNLNNLRNLAHIRRQLNQDRKNFNALRERLNVNKQKNNFPRMDNSKQKQAPRKERKKKYMNVLEYRQFKKEQVLKSYGRNKKRVKPKQR
ncbi:uncharacterized protein LOC111600528 isoform X3 [Drosophila hydei]|uniref:Uncharacterized protein LOC111600528 isoform X3 n=1 Tax=Drosophila hydei TaxID=7224 RepID=A0A6J2SVF4_DROHY|nr:uncharacterized protein LOC111600528 isoform X3 [Drosophila hydei]